VALVFVISLRSRGRTGTHSECKRRSPHLNPVEREVSIRPRFNKPGQVLVEITTDKAKVLNTAAVFLSKK